MILYYAMGGGLGHLTRARAVVHTLGLHDVAILSASPHLNDRRIIGDAEPIHVPPELEGDRDTWRAWLGALLRARNPEAIYIDTFAAGILGELCSFEWPPQIRLYYVARAMLWDRYAPLLGDAPPRFSACYMMEALDAQQMSFIEAQCDAIEPLVLSEPDTSLPSGIAVRVASIASMGRDLWLVVHSGPREEIDELIGYAYETAAIEGTNPVLMLVAPQSIELNVPDLEVVDCYPATPLFTHAARIITACGFNVMRQTEPYRRRHRMIPFPRRYDDQYRRKMFATGER